MWRTLGVSLACFGCTTIYYTNPPGGEDASVDVCVVVSGYQDRDGDGFGSGIAAQGCATEVSLTPTDCNDLCLTCYPGAQESCDGLDNNCNGVADDACVVDLPSDAGLDALPDASGVDVCTAIIWYEDVDQDSYGDPTTAMSACVAPPSFVSRALDCNDACSGCNPGIPGDVCGDGLDNNCSGLADEGCACGDIGDGCSGSTCCAQTPSGQPLSCRLSVDSNQNRRSLCCLESNGRCDSAYDCCGAMACTSGRCTRRADGAACLSPADCVSGSCTSGTCGTVAACSSNTGCTSCLNQPGCDWCAFALVGSAGLGNCRSHTEGCEFIEQRETMCPP